MTKKHEQRNTAVEQIVSQLDLSGMTQEELFGQNGLIKALTSRLLNRVLEAEMDAHLGYKKHSNVGDNSGNSRNGYSKKTVLTQDQEVENSIFRETEKVNLILKLFPNTRKGFRCLMSR